MQYNLPDHSVIITLTISQHVRDGVRSFDLTFVSLFLTLNTCPKFRCRHVQCPLKPDLEAATFTHFGGHVRFDGVCSHVLHSGILTLDVDDFVIDIGFGFRNDVDQPLSPPFLSPVVQFGVRYATFEIHFPAFSLTRTLASVYTLWQSTVAPF